MGLKMKKVNIMGVHWKIQFLGKVHKKNNIRELPKAGGGGLDSLQI